MGDVGVVVVPGAAAGVPRGDDVADDEVAQQAQHVEQHVEVADGPPGEGMAGVGEEGGVGEGEGGAGVAAVEGEGGARGELEQLRGGRTLPLERPFTPTVETQGVAARFRARIYAAMLGVVASCNTCGPGRGMHVLLVATVQVALLWATLGEMCVVWEGLQLLELLEL